MKETTKKQKIQNLNIIQKKLYKRLPLSSGKHVADFIYTSGNIFSPPLGISSDGGIALSFGTEEGV